MHGFEVAAIMLLIGFLGGVLAGIVVIVSVASRREDRYYSLTGEAPDAACRGARWLVGMGARGSGFPRMDPPPASQESDNSPSWPDSGFSG